MPISAPPLLLILHCNVTNISYTMTETVDFTSWLKVY